MKKNYNLNIKTKNILIFQKKIFLKNGGIAKCIEYENRLFFNSVNLNGKDLIEFGCGVFPSCIGLNNELMPKSYIATDTSKKILNAAKKNDNRPIYKIIDLEKKIVGKKKYDIIVLKGVLHHTKNPEKILLKLKDILRPNGIIIISEPNLSSLIGNFLKWFLEFFFKKNLEDSPYGQYNFSKISKSVKKANLKIHRKWYTSLILIIFTGDYGRVKFLPDSRLLFGILILFENIFYKIFSFLKIDKFLNFKLNLIIKP